MKSVYSAVRTGALNKEICGWCLEGQLLPISTITTLIRPFHKKPLHMVQIRQFIWDPIYIFINIYENFKIINNFKIRYIYNMMCRGSVMDAVSPYFCLILKKNPKKRFNENRKI